MFTIHTEMLQELEKEFKEMLVASSGVDRRFLEEQKNAFLIETKMAEADGVEMTEEELDRNVEVQLKNMPSVSKLLKSYEKVNEVIQNDG